MRARWAKIARRWRSSRARSPHYRLTISEREQRMDDWSRGSDRRQRRVARPAPRRHRTAAPTAGGSRHPRAVIAASRASLGPLEVRLERGRAGRGLDAAAVALSERLGPPRRDVAAWPYWRAVTPSPPPRTGGPFETAARGTAWRAKLSIRVHRGAIFGEGRRCAKDAGEADCQQSDSVSRGSNVTPRLQVRGIRPSHRASRFAGHAQGRAQGARAPSHLRGGRHRRYRAPVIRWSTPCGRGFLRG